MLLFSRYVRRLGVSFRFISRHSALLAEEARSNGYESKRCDLAGTQVSFKDSGSSGNSRATMDRLDGSSSRLDFATYASLLRECSNSKALSNGKRVHAHMVKAGCDRNTFLGNLVIQMYGNCGSLEDARAAFDRIRQQNVYSWNIMLAAYAQKGHLQEAQVMFEEMLERNVVTWNTMITAYAQNGHNEKALEVFRESLRHIKPNRVTYLSVLSACSSLGCIEEGKSIHDSIVTNGLQSDEVAIALVNMYGKCGSLEDARMVFNEIPDKEVVAWNALIAAYAQNGHLDEARCTFDTMPVRNVVSWNTMIAAYAQSGRSECALSIFRLMHLEGTQPNKTSFTSVLDASNSLAEGRAIHAKIVESGLESDVTVGTALVSMYGKCGSLDEAKRLFEQLPQKDVILRTAMLTAYAQNGHIQDARNLFDSMPHRNVVSWTAMISAYAQIGDGEATLGLFRMMDLEGVQPNRITLVCVLDACANDVALTEGKIIYTDIADHGYQLDSTVGTALVNLYGKRGCLQEARSIFGRMSEHNVITWTAMIAVYAQNGHRDKALDLLKVMDIEGVTPNEITFIGVLSVCSHAGQVEDAWHYFIAMVGDYGLMPMVDHYVCMIDVLGRAGRLSLAEELIDNMPFEPDPVAWQVLLGACTIHNDAERGARVARLMLKQVPEDSAPYVLLSNMYSTTAAAEKVP